MSTANLLLGPLLQIIAGLKELKLDATDIGVPAMIDAMLEKATTALYHEISIRGERDDVWKVAVRHNDAAGAVPYAMDQYGLTQPEAKVLINWYVDLCNSQATLLNVRPIDVIG